MVNHADGEETSIQKLRSILAQMEYTYQVCCWDANGVLFRTHVYVPEIHPVTEMEFHEREDEAHVLKVKLLFFFLGSYIIHYDKYLYSVSATVQGLEVPKSFSCKDFMKP